MGNRAEVVVGVVGVGADGADDVADGVAALALSDVLVEVVGADGGGMGRADWGAEWVEKAADLLVLHELSQAGVMVASE